MKRRIRSFIILLCTLLLIPVLPVYAGVYWGERVKITEDDTVLDTIEDSLQMDEQRILDAWKRSEHERRYTHEELLQELAE